MPKIPDFLDFERPCAYINAMTVLKIYVAPHPVLKKIAEPVAGGVTDDLRKLMDDMLETMYATRGIGLAAPQVGVSQRVIVMDIDQKGEDDEKPEKGQPRFFVNPEITWTSDDINVYQEGCLSVPGQYADVERPEKVRVKYLDYDGSEKELDCDGLLATCIQHEMDHLNGILFIDHLSTLKRDMLLRKLKKYTRDYADDMKDSHVL